MSKFMKVLSVSILCILLAINLSLPVMADSQTIRTVSGVIILPDGMIAPPNGISVEIRIENNISSTYSIVLIPEGMSSARYSLNVPASSGYRLSYYTTNQDYVNRMYYSAEGMVHASKAEMVDLSVEDKSDLKLTLIKKKMIHGKIQLKNGVISNGILNFTITAECGPDRISSMIPIPQGLNYVDYVLSVPPNDPGSGYKVSYKLSNNYMFMPVGYYSTNGTVQKASLASPIDVSIGDIKEIDLLVCEKKKISGTISLPQGVISSNDLNVTIYAENETETTCTMVIIPSGTSFAEYFLSLSYSEGYKVYYRLNNEAFISTGYYSQNGTVMQKDNATILDLTNVDMPRIDLSLINNTPSRYKVSGYIAPDFKVSENEAHIVNTGFSVEIAGISETTDENGYFQLNNIPSSTNKYTLKISKKNYLYREIKDLVVKENLQISSSNAPLLMWAGDMEKDGVQDNAINMLDIMVIAKVFNCSYGDAKYDSNYDFNKDNAINMSDVLIIAKHFNNTSLDY